MARPAKPYLRKQTKSWYCSINGQQISLGKERTAAFEIRRVRVEKAITLLCDTDIPGTRIATQCGFDRPELLTRAFRRELQATPSEFRRRLSKVH